MIWPGFAMGAQLRHALMERETARMTSQIKIPGIATHALGMATSRAVDHPPPPEWCSREVSANERRK